MDLIIENGLKLNPKADRDVLAFIQGFYANGDIRDTFMNGYCYYFAHMLKQAFNKGEVCWTVGIGHIVWVYNGIPYDVEGVYSGSANEFIPEEYLGEAINDFKRVPNIRFNATEEDIEAIIENYRNSIEGNKL